MTAQRAAGVAPFHVMDLLARARALEAQGRDIVHMEIGEPDFPTPAPIVEAGIAALRAGHTHYTPAAGLPALRAAIADYYESDYGVAIAPEQVIVTPGASGALQLALAALLDPQDELLLSDPGYPCNRHVTALLGARAVAVPVSAETDYQPTPRDLARHWTARTQAVLLASPSNPTGSVLDAAQLSALAGLVHERGGRLMVDEIYHGLTYGRRATSALAADARCYVVNSFSKYFGMTGWRVGWLVAPEEEIPVLERLAQNLFIAASTPAQHAALAAFLPETRALLEQRRAEFERRRDFLLPALQQLGFVIARPPAGAFYLYADAAAHTGDSLKLCLDLLDRAGVVITPGVDFGSHAAHTHVRFAYTTSLVRLAEGVTRLGRYLS